MVNFGGKYWQLLGSPFGLAHLTFLWDGVIQMIVQLGRKAGYMIFVYLDDILIFGNTLGEVSTAVKAVLKWLHDAGLTVNFPNNQLDPTQVSDHLGFTSDFVRGEIAVPQYKRKAHCKEVGKLLTKGEYTVRKMTAILGKIRSLLVALPALRAFTTLLQDFVARYGRFGWDSKDRIPNTVKEEMRRYGYLLQDCPGRPMSGDLLMRYLASDSLDNAHGGVEVRGTRVVHGFWKHRGAWHINMKELEASMQVVRGLAKP